MYIDLGKPLLNNLSEFTIVAWINRDPQANTPSADFEGWVGQLDVIEVARISNMVRVYPTTATHEKPLPHDQFGPDGWPHHGGGCYDPRVCVSTTLKLKPTDRERRFMIYLYAPQYLLACV